MFLKALARDLYKCQKEVEALERELQNELSHAEQERVKERLRKARGELAQIKKVLDGRKEQSRASQHKPKSRF